MTRPSTDSLIAEAEDENAEPLDSWEGAGAVSSMADMGDAWSAENPDPLQVAVQTAGAGLELLDAAMNPLSSLAEAAVGWLIEHIWWLHEPLDALAGDPTQIKAQAQTWHNVAQQLGSVAAAYRANVAGGVEGWEGGASESYRVTVDGFAGRLEESANHADQIASVLLMTGEAVGSLRGDIRDVIAEFLWLVIQLVAVSGLLAFLTVGGSLAAGAVRIVTSAVDLAIDNIRRISELLDLLSAAGGTAGRLADGMRDAALYTRAYAPLLQGVAGDVVDAAENTHVSDAIDVGKALTEAAQDQRGWSEEPTRTP